MVTRRKYQSSDTGLPVLGSRIQKLRELLHLSKTQFAIRIGYTSSQITRAENGDSAISTELCDRIVSTYGVRKEWLCGNEGEPWIDGKPEPQVDWAGERLRDVYLESGLSQREFCKRIGGGTSWLNALMEGRREMTRRFAERVEREFAVGADWLLYGDEMCKEWPCGDEMIGYLKKNPDVRREVWKKMKDSGQK